MKKYFYAILFLLVCCLTKEPSLEDQIFNCYKDILLEENVKVEYVIKKYENLLIKSKIIETREGESYLQLLRLILTNESELRNRKEVYLNGVKEINTVLNPYCDKLIIDINSENFKSSKYYTFIKEINQIYIDNDLQSEKLIDLFTSSDFNHPIYKIFIFNLLTNTYNLMR